MLTLRLPAYYRACTLAEQQGDSKPCFTSSESNATLADINPRSMQDQLKIASRYSAVVERVATRFGLMPSIVAGFCSRRSAWGLALDPTGVEGTRDFEPRPGSRHLSRTRLPKDGLGFVRGLAGLDVDRHGITDVVQWRDPESSLKAAFEIVAIYRRSLRRRTTLQGTGLLRASLTAFECGTLPVERAICAGLDVDSPTVGFDKYHQGCGSDVLARAAFFQGEGWD